MKFACCNKIRIYFIFDTFFFHTYRPHIHSIHSAYVVFFSLSGYFDGRILSHRTLCSRDERPYTTRLNEQNENEREQETQAMNIKKTVIKIYHQIIYMGNMSQFMNYIFFRLFVIADVPSVFHWSLPEFLTHFQWILAFFFRIRGSHNLSENLLRFIDIHHIDQWIYILQYVRFHATFHCIADTYIYIWMCVYFISD